VVAVAGAPVWVMEDRVTTESIIDALLQFRNVVLEGVPGTGKTFAARGVAHSWEARTGRELRGRAEGAYAITMHPSTSYEDFVEGLRYDRNSESFKRRDGFILRVVEAATKSADVDFLVLLDEINRTNVPKVLGDLLLTLEPTKRAVFDQAASEWKGGFSVTLPYSGRSFEMPDNIYVLASMNTSDQSIAPLDAALRRRFAFIRIEPLSADGILAAAQPDARPLIESSAQMLEHLNREILRPLLGPDGQLGHSYLLEIEPPRTPVVSDVLSTLVQHVDQTVTKVFWTEHRSSNGGSKNQFDLIASGSRGGHSSADLFYPLEGRPGPVRQSARRDHFDLVFGGNRYQENLIRWRGGELENGVWRLELQGQTSTGDRFSGIATRQEGTPSHPGAYALEQREIVWFRHTDDSFSIVRLQRDAATLQQLQQLSTWWDQSSPGRGFGEIDLQALVLPAPIANDEPYITWRYAIIPQLIAVLEARDGQELFGDADERELWLKSRGHDKPAALEQFDAFLSQLGLRLELAGSGLGRTLRAVGI
jgi:AAA domain (dynein-related subfamily)